ncbi:MAG: Holliday junction branch migration protein RuvA [Lentisphaeraceae bacterium]|nr:Holliday junction branch migration protein RuvA [Lentisphaeraceae bacterium]
MIHHVKGTLVELELTHAVVDIQGLGYFINIPMSTYDRLPRVGAEVALRTHMVVREDDMSLYGFAGEEERKLFRLLINVSGIGAKTAVAVLSSLPVANFCDAVVNADVKVISKISGIGKKTAERLVIELRDKVSTMVAGKIIGNTVDLDVEDDDSNTAINDALLALETLGYRPDKIRKVIKGVVDNMDKSKLASEDIIRQALAELNS